MPIELTWDNPEKTITRLEFSGRISMTELLEAWTAELNLQKSVVHPVYSLNVFHEMYPAVEGASLTDVRSFICNNKPDHLQLTVQVAENMILRRALLTVSTAMSHPVRVVSHLEEAYAIIHLHQVTQSASQNML